MFEVILSPEASDFYSLADLPLAKKIARCFGQLEHDPRRHRNIKRLKGDFAGLYRYRIGDYRIVYRIEQDERKAFVLAIAHRREVYE